MSSPSRKPSFLPWETTAASGGRRGGRRRLGSRSGSEAEGDEARRPGFREVFLVTGHLRRHRSYCCQRPTLGCSESSERLPLDQQPLPAAGTDCPRPCSWVCWLQSPMYCSACTELAGRRMPGAGTVTKTTFALSHCRPSAPSHTRMLVSRCVLRLPWGRHCYTCDCTGEGDGKRHLMSQQASKTILGLLWHSFCPCESEVHCLQSLSSSFIRDRVSSLSYLLSQIPLPGVLASTALRCPAQPWLH
ncbi:PREDICTED: uncharacterized protein LOC102027884 isoform X2 [Chinchilla lanigera]|uniref:uncharacterized protein LOC102027884 isoform X2 n=1 Tax=Chinchilla lanigera TaxID=34839 RepID=UPI0006964243|nr:PREDICTED: uncharacterized protein LOC102027884 isoform X2 [Chinchilla lanigera]